MRDGFGQDATMARTNDRMASLDPSVCCLTDVVPRSAGVAASIRGDHDRSDAQPLAWLTTRGDPRLDQDPPDRRHVSWRILL